MNRPLLVRLAVFVALGAYLVLYYATRLPILEGLTGGAFRRVDYFWLLLLPEELVRGWFGEPAEFAVADRLPVLAIAAAILGCSACLGWLLLALVRIDRGLTRLEAVVFSAGVGLNAVSTYVLLVGLAGLLGNPLVFSLPGTATLLLGGYLAWKRKAGDRQAKVPVATGGSLRLTQAPPPGGREDEAPFGLSWLWLALPFVLMIVLGGMLPPIEFDVREYHLQVPKEFHQQGRIGFLPHNVYGNMPLATEMLSLLAMEIAGDWWLGALAGKTVVAAFAPLTALALLAAGRRLFSPAAGVFAAVVYISTPWIAFVSTNGLVEGAAAFYLLTAAYAALVSTKGAGSLFSPHPRSSNPPHDEPGQPRRWAPASISTAALAGYLAGAAVSCKYPAALFVVVPLLAWLALDQFGADGRIAWKPAGVFLLTVALGCGLWLGKNGVLAGNPTYPLLYRVFGGRTWTDEKNERWNRVHRAHDFSATALARDLGRVGWRSPWLSPLVLPLAALAFVPSRNRRIATILAAHVVFVIACWWLLTHRLDRFWLPALPLAALLAGAGACWSRQRWWRAALVGLFAVASISNFLMAASAGPAKYNRYFVSLARLRVDPMRVDAWHRYFNDHVAEGRVLMVGDAEVFDLEVPILYNTCFDDSIFERLVQGRTASEVAAALQSRQISHVYVHWGEIARYRSPGNYGYTDFVAPGVFDRLVEQGVLWPLPAIDDHPGRAYRVPGGKPGTDLNRLPPSRMLKTDLGARWPRNQVQRLDDEEPRRADCLSRAGGGMGSS